MPHGVAQPDCGEPGCTGVHNRARPYAELCPRTRRQAGDHRPRQLGMQLLKGKPVLSRAAHHMGMAWVKAMLGDPRPSPDHQLSMQVIDGPSVYWGYDGNLAGPRLLSLDPDDFTWETGPENMARIPQHRYERLERAYNRSL